MAYQATILNVMIASPSDVAEERQLIRDAIYEWNAIHSKQLGIMLNPVGWETHIAPEMGNHPQEIINKRILDNSDILIGIFWTRLGSPTGEYVSGTVEEISKHIASQKLASIYVCNKPIPPSQITEQYQKLQVQIREWMPTGVIDFYNDLSNFKQKIKDHLSLHIQQNEYIQNILANIPQKNGTSFLEKNSIETTEEMEKILLNAAKKDDEILIHRDVDKLSNITIGELNLSLNEIDSNQWEKAIDKLEYLRLIKAQTSKRKQFKLTYKGWQAFDQLKAEHEENQ